jgi:hypothetical protein
VQPKSRAAFIDADGCKAYISQAREAFERQLARQQAEGRAA